MLAIFPFPYVLNALAVLAQAAVGKGTPGPISHSRSRVTSRLSFLIDLVLALEPLAAGRARRLPAVDLRRGRQPRDRARPVRSPAGPRARPPGLPALLPAARGWRRPAASGVARPRDRTCHAEPAAVLLDRRGRHSRSQPAWSRRSWCSAFSSGASSSWACGRRSSSPWPCSSGSRTTSTTAGAYLPILAWAVGERAHVPALPEAGSVHRRACRSGTWDSYSCLSSAERPLGGRGAAVGAVDVSLFWLDVARTGSQRRPPAPPRSSPRWWAG